MRVVGFITPVIWLFFLLASFSYGYNRVEKIGIVDLTEVFDNFVEGKEIGREFSEYKKSSSARLEGMRRELSDLRAKLNEVSNAVLSRGTNVDSQTLQTYNQLLQEYQAKVEAYVNEARKVEENLNKYRDVLKQYVYKDVLNYIKSYGDKNGFSVIFDTRGNIIYHSRGNDVTSDLNKWIKVQEEAKKKY